MKNFICFVLTIFGILLTIMACKGPIRWTDEGTTTTTTVTTTVPTTTTTVTLPPQTTKAEMIPLSWEKNNPERKNWSNFIYNKLDSEYFPFLDSATDMKRFCTKYYSLTKQQKMNVWGEFWSATTYYESSWNPKSQAVDVGSPNNKDSWSIGLTQISVRDYQNKFKYNFDQLITPNPNLHLALEIMKIQIQKTGLVILPNTNRNRYWAVILDGNKYSQIPKITAMTQKLPFCN